jgi:hypothetical protein
MADADFPSRFEQEARRQERAVDEHRRREELEAEVVRLRAESARYRGRAHRAEYIVVRLAVTLSRYSGFDPDALIQAHAPENARPPTPPRDDG